MSILKRIGRGFRRVTRKVVRTAKRVVRKAAPVLQLIPHPAAQGLAALGSIPSSRMQRQAAALSGVSPVPRPLPGMGGIRTFAPRPLTFGHTGGATGGLAPGLNPCEVMLQIVAEGARRGRRLRFR